MSGFLRYNKILNLFSEYRSSWTVAEISEKLKTPSSTIYRIVREMVLAEFLESAAGAYFRLGPAFIKFNRTINLSDPLVRAGQPFLEKLANENPIVSVNVLARLYSKKVMCVADFKSPSFKNNTSYQKGKLMPLMYGATSRAIIMQINGKRLEDLLSSETFKTGNEKDYFLKSLKNDKKKGYCCTQGQVDRDLIGFAVPIHSKKLGIEASLSSIFNLKDFLPEHEPIIYANLSSYGLLIEKYISQILNDIEIYHHNGVSLTKEEI
ncbi:helix-turn-helix domain-containing protein [Alphaproteobacteria bacterium]|nr:helix-turn-helix domain-containing protein [Alphaproteobacteria bacterium]